MAKEVSLKIDSVLSGHRIEYVLEKKMQLSSSLIKRLKREDGGILLNGVKATVIKKVSEGDILTVNIAGKDAKNIIPVNIPIDILLEDEDILLVNKSGSMPVHPSSAHKEDTLANAVLYHLGEEKAIHIITRLDRETSGVVLIAKNPMAAALLTDDMKHGKVEKEYVAIVNGFPEKSEGKIIAPIKKNDEKGIARCVSPDGKESVTLYELIKKTDKFSLMKLIPVTGRTHQLRVHMSHIGHAIYGDAMYGAEQTGERTRLHCRKITFNHPTTKEKITVTATLPEDFSAII